MFDANSTTQEIEFDQHDKTMAALTSGQSCLTSVFQNGVDLYQKLIQKRSFIASKNDPPVAA
tara:strand:- start:5222 stop:5407 length:186 start_codon:yes stop_codon:yes gene_type:complete